MRTRMSESTYRLALVVSQFNPEVTHGLRDGALAHLAENGVSIAPDHVYSAPGAFEIPLIAKR
ncbi:6,7-dimethyl-8-ribityllumazine synthase, partial [Devosia indica]